MNFARSIKMLSNSIAGFLKVYKDYQKIEEIYHEEKRKLSLINDKMDEVNIKVADDLLNK